MGPTKAVIRNLALYEAKTGKVIQEQFSNTQELEHYVNHHYLVLPVTNYAGTLWNLDGKLIYRIHGVTYETIDGERVALGQCRQCGGMGIRLNEPNVESDCFRCTDCGHEFNIRLEMMES